MRHLIVLARWPAHGRCKGRLTRSCGSAAAAARVQRALTEHTLAVAGEAARRCGARLMLASDGLGDRALRRWARQLGVDHRQRQGGGSLGCRLQRQLRRSFSAGAAQVVLIGSDLPALEHTDLTGAFAALERSALVLGPASDGGYWLIGLNRAGHRRAGARLTSGIPWGSGEVLAATLARAAAIGLSPSLLRRQSDLDQREDLRPWIQPGPLR
ncbi:MAG: hypothetical protein RLZZ219_1875 [Cyanobacteriota bacterium]|jgi:rSAM/selenodomain-associated transferase 1